MTSLLFSRIKRHPRLCRFGIPLLLLTVAFLLDYLDFWATHPRGKRLLVTIPAMAALTLCLLGFFPDYFNRWRHRFWRAILDGLFSPPAVAIYAGCAGLFQSLQKNYGEKWEFFRNHPGKVEYLLLLSFFVPAASAVGVLWRAKATATSLKKTEELLYEFVQMVARIVDAKLKVLEDAAQKAKRSGKFDTVTKPDDQLRVIFQHSAVFLCHSFSLTDEQVDFTVLEYCSLRGTWNWAAYYHKRPACSPDDLLQPGRAAAVANKEGQVFIPSKLVASEEGAYWPSTTRNERGKDGSIFCFKSSVKCPGFERNYIVSIVSYDIRFCDPGDDVNEKKTKTFLREIVRRIEIELHYRTIKAI